MEVGLNLKTFLSFLFHKLLTWKIRITVDGCQMLVKGDSAFKLTHKHLHLFLQRRLCFNTSKFFPVLCYKHDKSFMTCMSSLVSSSLFISTLCSTWSSVCFSPLVMRWLWSEKKQKKGIRLQCLNSLTLF